MTSSPFRSRLKALRFCVAREVIRAYEANAGILTVPLPRARGLARAIHAFDQATRPSPRTEEKI
ncbi:hypothetical protein CLM82_10155 [Streptomyces albidoflavus]|nr:hypothetical protein CLM82_10155 [Streptomyces albidoflavus]